MPREKITDGTKKVLSRAYPSEIEFEVLGKKTCREVSEKAITEKYKAYIESIEVKTTTL